MKKLLCCLSFFITFLSYGQQLSVEQLRQDFDTLCSALREGHGGLYRHHSKKEIDLHFSRHREKLNKPMSQHAFYGFLSKFLSYIGDGHMRIDYDEAIMASRPRLLLFPFRILTDKYKTIILSNDTRADTVIKPGMELLSINGNSIKNIKDKIISCMRGDGQIITGKLTRFENGFHTQYWTIIDTSASFTVKVKDQTGKVFTTTVKGVVNSERESNRNQNPVNAGVLPRTRALDGPADNLSLRFINDSIASLRIRLFDGRQFIREADSLFALINSKNTKALIIDLRTNRGGLDHLGSCLLSHLTTKPFRYLDRIHARVLVPAYASWKSKPPVDLINGTYPDAEGGYWLKPMLNNVLEEQRPAQPIFTGKLIVLIGGLTFSAGSDFSAILDHNRPDAIFVGDETGGGYQGNTSGLSAILKLPNSPFNVTIHLWDYWSAVPAPATKGRGVMPDYPIERNNTEWLDGIDNQWEFALNLLLGNTSTGFKKKQFVSGNDTLPYRLLYPLNYNPAKKYPLVLFLHGAGTVGTDNEKQLKGLPPLFLDSQNRKKHPCFLLVPQCTRNEPWVSFPGFPNSIATPDTPTTSAKLTLELINVLKKELPVNQKHIYITGASLGGEGTFDFLSRAPKLFAAAIPICGVADTAKAKIYKDVPLWAFHGDEDNVNEVKYTRMIIASLKKAGGKPRYTEYKGVKHNSWTRAYEEPELLTWLFNK